MVSEKIIWFQKIPMVQENSYETFRKNRKHTNLQNIDFSGSTSCSRKIVKNIELWMELDDLTCKFSIKWTWVKSHSDNEMNNEVDKLAREAANSV